MYPQRRSSAVTTTAPHVLFLIGYNMQYTLFKVQLQYQQITDATAVFCQSYLGMLLKLQSAYTRLMTTFSLSISQFRDFCSLFNTHTFNRQQLNELLELKDTQCGNCNIYRRCDNQILLLLLLLFQASEPYSRDDWKST